MKHIKRKFLNEYIVPDTALKATITLSDAKHVKKNSKDTFLLVNPTENKMIKGYLYRKNGTDYIMPEIDPVLIYFNNAQLHLKFIKVSKNKLLKLLNVDDEIITNEVANTIFEFYGRCTSVIIFLYTAIEAAVNKKIPNDLVYKREFKSKTEIFNHNQVQRLSLKEKIEDVLSKPPINLDFKKSHPLKYQFIENLQEFRDGIIHTKKESSDNNVYGHLYKKALDFDYSKAVTTVAELINFYHPSYIEECNCGQDF